ncbi:MAG: hypothetical protein Kow00108_10180 [Calditrichia bacterium]
MSLFTINTDTANDSGILYLTGYINEEAGEKIREKSEVFFSSGVKNIVIDMKKVSLINSMGIAVLISLLNKLLIVKGRLIIITDNELIKKTLSIMGLQKYCTIVDDVNQVEL